MEILSKDAAMLYMQEKIDLLPALRRPLHLDHQSTLGQGYNATRAGMVEAESGRLTTGDPEIRAPVAAIEMD